MPKFTARLPLLLKEQTEWLYIPAKLRPYISDTAKVQSGYVISTLAPHENPAVSHLRAKLKRQKVAFTETLDEHGFIIFTAE